MKRTNHLLSRIYDIDNLRLAFWKARKGKNHSQQVEAYRKCLDKNLLQLSDQIYSGDVEVGDYHFFKVYDPKERDICAPAFREQVLHHALMNVCHDTFEKKQIFDSYASRKGRGTYAALQRAQHFTKSNAWYLKMDVRKFFASVHHQVLKTQLQRMFKEEQLLGIFYKIMDSYEASEGRGVPIGNLTSQYFANHYLVSLDYCIKERLRIRHYVRYMDDLVLWNENKATLKAAAGQIEYFIHDQLKCAVKPIQLNKTTRGLPFLGYIVFPYKIKLSHRSKHRFIQKYRSIEEKRKKGVWDEKTCQRHILPLLAFAEKANTLQWRKKVIGLAP